jgi:LPXTG-motif cell wall-anchored protein
MKHTKRGLLASVGALATAAALAMSGAVAANAAPGKMPDKSDITITKLSVPPTGPGAAANGVASGSAGGPTIPAEAEPIRDVKFEAYAVPITTTNTPSVTLTPGTNEWQQRISSIGLAEAAGLIGTTPVAGNPFALTDVNGVTVWKDAPWGLYLIREVSAPEGVTKAGDFLVAVPLTNPVNHSEWLNNIHVYPKNAKVGATKTVVNADALTVGEDATWTISADIPRNPNPAGTPAFLAPDAFEIHDTLQDDELVLSTTTPIVVTAGATTLTLGDDYTVTPDTSVTGETTHKVIFTPDGRAALATAVNASSAAKVTVTLVTTVKKAADIANTGKVFPNQQAITAGTPLTTDPVNAKYGSYQIVKKSTDSSADLSGAEFKVYPSKADAEAGTNALAPLDDAGAAHSTWTTNAAGNVTIQGLRFSGFADGAPQSKYVDNGDTCANYATGGVNCAPNPKYQTYWLVETKALAGHQLLAAPVEITIDAASATQTSQEIVNQKNAGGFVLPLTGGMGTTLFTVFGIAILAIVLFVVVRRRRNEDAHAE